jgi:hypothetical protein
LDHRQIRVVQVEQHRFDVRQSPMLALRREGVEKPLRAIDRHNATGRPDNLRQVKRRVPRAAANIQHGLAHGEPRSPPGIQRSRAPHTMLQTQPRQLLIMRPQHIVAF